MESSYVPPLRTVSKFRTLLRHIFKPGKRNHAVNNSFDRVSVLLSPELPSNSEYFRFTDWLTNLLPSQHPDSCSKYLRSRRVVRIKFRRCKKRVWPQSWLANVRNRAVASVG